MTLFNRVLIGTVVAGALVAGPMAALAHNGADYDSAGVHKVGSQLSVQINDNGNATIRGAKITSINGANVSAATAFGSTSVSWTIATNGSTKFLDKGGRASALANMHVGDVVSF